MKKLSLQLVKITNFTTKSALRKRLQSEKSEAPQGRQLEMQYLVPLKLITFRLCHEFGVLSLIIAIYYHLIWSRNNILLLI